MWNQKRQVSAAEGLLGASSSLKMASTSSGQEKHWLAAIAVGNVREMKVVATHLYRVSEP